VAVLLAALDHKARTGQGQHIDLSQAEASLHLLAPALLDHELTGTVLNRAGNRPPELVPHGVFRCAARGDDDDRWIAIVADGDETWRRLAAAMGRDHLADLTTAERRAGEEELEAVIERWARGHDEDALTERLQGLGMPAHGVQNSPELWADPQLAHRGHFARTDHAVHPDLVVEASRFLLSRSAPARYGPPPTLGQHAYEVLHDLLGYDDDRIADIAATGVLE
jgi:benzylsuccinate CoA-transferase BbsF subunit